MGDLLNNINKNRSIKILLSRILPIIKVKKIKIVNFWDADPSAIGLSKDGKLLYVNESCLKYGRLKIHSMILRFDCDLEYYNSEEDLVGCKNKLKVKKYLNLTIKDIKGLMRKFFGY